jgi:hypothetical protein
MKTETLPQPTATRAALPPLAHRRCQLCLGRVCDGQPATKRPAPHTAPRCVVCLDVEMTYQHRRECKGPSPR